MGVGYLSQARCFLVSNVALTVFTARLIYACLRTSAECCLVLDGLSQNSSVKKFSMSSEIGILCCCGACVRGGLHLCCRPLLVTLACATGCELGDEGARRAQHVLERNTTLTELDLACKGFVFV
jgi:hypothetical protein